MAIDPVTLVVGIVISVGLAFAAQALLKPKDKSFIKDDKPTTLAVRGAFLPYLIGRRRVGAIFCWAGDRFSQKEKISGGGKGGVLKAPVPKTLVYYESCWHSLCLGPVFRLHRIYQAGSIIYEGPIDSVSHPSGSTINTLDGDCTIYWGQEDQPVNMYLGSAGHVVDSTGTPIQSRWPFICYVVWRDKRLGGSPIWPLIEYDVETRIQESSFCSGPPWIENSKILTGSAFPIHGVINGVPGVNAITVLGKVDYAFRNGGFAQIAGNVAGVNGTYKILKVLHGRGSYDPGGAAGPVSESIKSTTTIYLDATLTGATVSGTIQAYAFGDDDGVNPAHAAAQLLFGKNPQGLSLDPADFDLNTLDDLSQICVDEGLSCSLISLNGDTLEGLLASVMQDVGFIIPWDVSRGKYVFRTIRLEDPADVTAVDPDIMLPPKAEISVVQGEKPVDKIIFIFSDRDRNYRDMTIQIDDDSQETLLEFQRIQKVQLPSVISFNVANRVAERRAVEALSGGSAVSFKFNRGARFFVPGQAFTVPGYPGTYRVERMVIDDSLSGVVSIRAIVDVWGSKASTFTNPGSGGTQPPGVIPVEDLAYDFIEVPSHVSPGAERIIVPRIRGSNMIVGADIWLSRDDATYSRAADDDSAFTGGLLNAQLEADTFQYLGQGPVITALGPDIASVLDLSGDLPSFGAGRQLCIIDNEIFYLKKVTALGGDQYRLDGLLRARFDTQRAVHPAQSAVFIFLDDVLQIDDALLSPAQVLYMKPQPKTTISIPLSEVAPVQKTLVGKGVTPMAIEILCAADAAAPKFIPNNGWPIGGGALIKWAYRSYELSRSGAGLQGYGKPAGTSGTQGDFTIRMKTTGDVLKKEYSSSTPDFSYSQALMVADFGAEPAAFKVEVLNINGGLAGPSRVITVNRF